MMQTMSTRVAFAAIASIICAVAAPVTAFAQVGSAELLVRIDRLENQVRQLNGLIEQLQYQNQQLEGALRRLQGDSASQDLASRGGPPIVTAPSRPGVGPPIQPPVSGLPPVSGGRRGDAFDPTENPNAPGAPRVLGSIPPSAPAPAISPRGITGERGIVGEEPTPYRGTTPTAGLEPGSARVPTGPATRSLDSTGSYPVATAPTSSPREFFDLGTGYLQRKEYALAEEVFRDFLKKYPSDRLAADAQYGLGESFFQRQSYHDAANAFVVLSKKYETSAKAPDALLRLGQSLAAINEKELACVAFGDVGRKYPRAAPSVKQAIEREQKRVRC